MTSDHEQGHSDINEIARIDLQRNLNKTLFDKDSIRVQLTTIQTKFNMHYDSLQKAYDLETDHMANREKQAEWKKRIAALAEMIRRNWPGSFTPLNYYDLYLSDLKIIKHV